MVVGRGMIARAFDSYRERPDVVIFASGVSDSTETESAKFGREEALLSTTLGARPNARFVYFGTCSVADPEQAGSPYAKHKLSMEALIGSRASNFLIFRLPQVIGRGGNENTIVNRLCRNIRGGERFQVWKNAYRYIVDVQHVFAIAGDMIERSEYGNRIVNIASRRVSIFAIVRALENATRRKALYTEVDKGASFDIDSREAHDIASRLGIAFDDGYLERAIQKYYGTGAE